MLSKDPVYHGRKYIISYFLADDTINIHDGETAPNTGEKFGGIQTIQFRKSEGLKSTVAPGVAFSPYN